ncbi:MAG: hypothetical protein WCH78_13030 [Bacteroidota bacterium]
MRLIAPFFKTLMLFAGICLAMGAAAQKTNFLFIQSEPKIPFTVQIGDKTFHSNTSGYLKIPSLPVSDYTLLVSFPMNQFSSQTYLVELKDKDRGFWLKQDLDNSLVLKDQVSLALIRNAVGNDFGKINYDNKSNRTVVDSISTNAKGERIKINNPNLGHGTSVTYTAPPKLGPPATSVTKTYEKVGVNGINQAYAVLNGSKLDTIFIFIPALDDTKDIPTPVKKRTKEANQKEDETMGPNFDLPMPSNAIVPKKAKTSHK